MNRVSPTMFSAIGADGGPLLSSSGRVAVGSVTARQVDGGRLSPVDDRPFLLCFLEPIKAGKHDKTGCDSTGDNEPRRPGRGQRGSWPTRLRALIHGELSTDDGSDCHPPR